MSNHNPKRLTINNKSIQSMLVAGKNSDSDSVARRAVVTKRAARVKPSMPTMPWDSVAVEVTTDKSVVAPTKMPRRSKYD